MKTNYILSLKTLIFLSMFLVFFSPTYGEFYSHVKKTSLQDEVTISGTVRSEQTNEPISGVTIRANNESISSTDDNGRFEINVKANDLISFESIGFVKKEQRFQGNQSSITIFLQDSSVDISEVVVTALGIEREAKGLGYGVSTVKGDALTESKSTNWSDGLKGKVAGLDLTQASSGPINSTRISLRGDQSLSGNNEALVVIDGTPMVNGQLSSGVSDAYGVGSTDVRIDF